jgi:hypothetical protein
MLKEYIVHGIWTKRLMQLNLFLLTIIVLTLVANALLFDYSSSVLKTAATLLIFFYYPAFLLFQIVSGDFLVGHMNIQTMLGIVLGTLQWYFIGIIIDAIRQRSNRTRTHPPS